jgi:hypothetical protein
MQARLEQHHARSVPQLAVHGLALPQMQILKIIRMSNKEQSVIICNRIDVIRKEIDAAEGRRALAAKKLREARALAEDYNCHYLEYCQALDYLNEELADLVNELAKLDNDEQ